MATFAQSRSDPHFTVDGTRIFQHVDTAEGARALRNAPGGVQTNRDSAVQIELVGFAHLPKSRESITLLARLCRWIESTHGVPPTWPAGLPRPARNGKDPGGHNRPAAVWDSQSGHYGHCHVPENTHWDPGYSADEVAFIMAATFDAQGRLVAPLPAVAAAVAVAGAALRAKAPRAAAPMRLAVSTMPDHGVVPVGMTAYVRELALAHAPAGHDPGHDHGHAHAPDPARKACRAAKAAAPAWQRAGAALAAAPGQAVVNVGSLLSFVEGVGEQEKNDVLYSVQLAQRGASGSFDRFTQTPAWYGKYVEILQNLGWNADQWAFGHFDQVEGEFRMDQAALAIVTAIATQNQLAVLQQSVAALSKLAEGDAALRLFDFHSSMQGNGNFQLGAVQRCANGALSMALGAFYFRGVDERQRFLFFKWGSRQVNFWTSAQRLTLNSDFYARRRDDVLARLEADAPTFIADLRLGAR